MAMNKQISKDIIFCNNIKLINFIVAKYSAKRALLCLELIKVS